jgi:hypothetical protein
MWKKKKCEGMGFSRDPRDSGISKRPERQRSAEIKPVLNA